MAASGNRMKQMTTTYPFDQLAAQLDGEVFHDQVWRLLHATDASVFREIPAGICRPASTDDLKAIMGFCREHKLPIIPRTAGTSLAGQVVGHGLVVDFSRHMNKILELNTEENWVRVQPGVILDDLNRHLEPHGLFFGPETSTGNRCMIGGMVANNSCGSHSLVYGSTRDHTLEIKALLSDGSTAIFNSLNREEFLQKCVGSSLENKLYRQILELLSNPENQSEILNHYPDPRLHRRNTGYALDLLLDSEVFKGADTFNFCKLLCGSEGTLALFTEITLNLVPLPPDEKAVVCVHLENIDEALEANVIALKHHPVAVELIDKIILDCTRDNLSQAKNRFFLQGDPGAILVVEFASHDTVELFERVKKLQEHLQYENLGFHYPMLRHGDIAKVWDLRKSGLGLLSNMPGDAKPVAVIEDVAVHVEQLKDFLVDLRKILASLGLECVYYAHIGTGELHLRPVLNLKSRPDIERFYQIARQTALLVKQYRGSLSGEHGDGRLRGPFIPIVIGEKNYQMLIQVKNTWDQNNLLNPGKITGAPDIKSSLRYEAGKPEKKLKTYFSYDSSLGFIRAVEKCNGSGDCRKPHQAGGVMCPSYHATLDEKDSTRARANILREFVSNSAKANPFNHKEIMDILDLCLSCKGCKAECPSSVDMGKYKAEVQQQYYDANGTPFRSRVTGAYAKLSKAGSLSPVLYNFLAQNNPGAYFIKSLLGYESRRKLPVMSKQSLRKWANRNLPPLNRKLKGNKKVFLFCDEFTNYNDTNAGISCIMLLHYLGYQVDIPQHLESGRTYLSKGLLKKAESIATKNVRLLNQVINKNTPLIGIEPSALLCFRDEYPDMLKDEYKDQALSLSEHSFLLDEFFCNELELGHIDNSLFNTKSMSIYLHGHCHQKALSSTNHTLRMLSCIPGAKISEINCGCCGMAGAFGFEKEHYEISMRIGELSLFPAVRKAGKDTVIAASGTSCRQQILEGTGRKAWHPAEIMYHAFRGYPLED